VIALSNRVHSFAHPANKEKLIAFFTNILGCEVLEIPAGPGVPSPAVAFTFPGGGSLSFEFTEDALDERQARRAPYLELRSDDPSALKQKIIEAGLPGVEEYTTGEYFYFQAPGGQVIRIVPAGGG
jgi:catechol 2,3-dioxygenase-like lactoylglutathione lyase family enzyme